MAQKLSEFLPGGQADFIRTRAVGAQPEAMLEVMNILSTWSVMDLELSGVVSVMLLQADFRVTEEFVMAVPWGQRLRVIRRCAIRNLENPDRDMLLRVLIAIGDLEDLRHRFAHHLWGSVKPAGAGTQPVENVVALVDPKHVIRKDATLREGGSAGGGIAYEAPERKIVVYTLDELSGYLASVSRAVGYVQMLGDMHSDPEVLGILDASLPPLAP